MYKTYIVKQLDLYNQSKHSNSDRRMFVQAPPLEARNVLISHFPSLLLLLFVVKAQKECDLISYYFFFCKTRENKHKKGDYNLFDFSSHVNFNPVASP